jgi:predicted membrane protein
MRPLLTPQLVVGLIAVTLGLLLTLDNLGLIHSEDYLRYWPAGLIALGAVKLSQSRAAAGTGLGGLLLVVIGALLLVDRTMTIEFDVWRLWPVALVILGGALVYQTLSGPRARAVADGAAVVTAMAFLGAVSRGSNSPRFRGGSLTAVMGGCDLDLRHAAIDGDAVLEVFAMWGGIEIRVPEDWTVVSQVVPIMAGVDDRTRPPQGLTRHRLVLRGFMIMAGIEIKH